MHAHLLIRALRYTTHVLVTFRQTTAVLSTGVTRIQTTACTGTQTTSRTNNMQLRPAGSTVYSYSESEATHVLNRVTCACPVLLYH
jgi:hypothetical protein